MTNTDTARAGHDAAFAAPVPDGRAQLAELLTTADIATAVLGLDGSVIDANDAARAVFADFGGAAPDGARLLTVRNVLEQVPRRLFEDTAGGSWTGDVDTDHGTGQPVETTVVVHHDASDPMGGTVALMCRAVPLERRQTAELERRLETDDITGLPNRAATFDLAARLIATPGEPESRLAVLLIDIDRLHDVNDALGYAVGDRLIASIATRLHTAIRPSDTVGRIGGDEFAVFCPDVPDAASALDVAARLRAALTGRLTIQGLELDVSVSVGVSVADDSIDASTDGAAELISRADAAARSAKSAGRGGCSLFEPELRAQALRRTELTAALTKALRDGELLVEYQPIFSAVSERAEAAEALVRWAHPTRGRIEASAFIPVAEETGVIIGLGDWVLAEACAAARRWIDDGTVGPKFAVHVNVSRLQLADPGFVDRVVGVLREHQLRPPQLVLEAREATLLGDADSVVRAVQALRRVGVRIALDNFGTGSNALSLLTDVGADVLKLDGTLALPSGSSEADTRVARALVLLAHALNMEVVAERVAGMEQLRRLRAAGCDMVQGHLVGSPTAADRLITHIDL